MRNIVRYSDYNQLNEEIDWESIKYNLAKLGSITKGGKFFGRKEQEAKAKEEMDAILKDANNKFIISMDKKIKEVAPEFPNNKSRKQFLDALSIIAATYDSIVQACHQTYGIYKFAANRKDTDEAQQGKILKDNSGNPKLFLKPGDENFLTVDMANALIQSLQKYLKKLIDYDLSTAYTVLENQNLTQEEISLLENVDVLLQSINEEISLNPFKWFGKKSQQSSPALTAGTETETKKMVSSSKYEKIIGALGVALGVFGWVVQTDWFRDLLVNWFDKPEITKDVVSTDIKDLSVEIKNGEGLTQALNRTLGTNFGPNTPTTEFISTLKDKGLGNTPAEIFKNLNFESSSPNPNFGSDVVKALSGGGNLKSAFTGIFSGLGGSALQVNPGIFIAKQITTTVTKVVIQEAVKTGTVIATGLSAAGPLISGLGIAMVAGAITSWLLKRKARKSSRYKDLQELLEKLKLIEIEERTGSTPVEDDSGVSQKSELTESSVYPVMIKNLTALKNILANYEYVRLEGESDVRDTTTKGKRFKEGGIYTFTNAKGEKKKVKLLSLTHEMDIGDDKNWLSADDFKKKNLNKNYASVIFTDAQGKYSSKSPVMAVKLDQLSESHVKLFNQFIIEKDEFGKSVGAEIMKDEKYLTEAFTKLRRAIKVLIDDKDKGVGITAPFLDEVLKEKMKSKETIKKLYQEIWEHLRGKYKVTMPQLDALYKESITVVEDKRKIVAEKIARFSLRTMQFEGEGFYGGLATLGDYIETFNVTLKEILDYYDTKLSQ